MPVAVGALTLLVLVLAVLLLLGRARTGRELETARTEALALRAQVAEIERRLRRPAAPVGGPDLPEYVITHVGEELRLPRHASVPVGPAVGDVRIEPALFADLVLRETVVRAAALAHGVRVALAPESRNRIRFEVRREIRRARKQRRLQLKTARRDLESRQRAELIDGESVA